MDVVWGLPRCVWARESTAPAQGNQSLPSAQRFVWAAKHPLGNAALGALFACPEDARGCHCPFIWCLPPQGCLRRGQEARLLGHSSRHSIPGAPINPSSGPFWSRKFYQGESEFLETVKDGSPWCGSKWPWMGPDGVHSVVRAQQWAAAWVCVRGSLIHRMAETHILSSPPGQWGVILPAYPESEDSLNQET